MSTKKIIPESLKNPETREVIKAIVKELKKQGGGLDAGDIPAIHRMATAFDLYLTCAKILHEEGATMINAKGESVKRPEANILKENWAQYLELAKEYGFTARSRIGLNVEQDDDSPFEMFLKRFEYDVKRYR